MKKKDIYTIKDIADLADVSRATVDRVIHGRGKVSQEAYKRVKHILDSINYQPNLIAQTLKKGELHKIALFMPDPDFDIYWKRAQTGAHEAISDFSFIGIHVDEFLFNPFKGASFKINAKQIYKGQYDAVLVAPVFYHEAIEFFKTCETLKLPYLTFNTHIQESNPLCHIGQDLIQSGEAAASLFHKTVGKDDELLILHIDEDLSNSKHMQEKEDGFIGFFKNSGYDGSKVKVIKVDKASQVEKQLTDVLENSKKIKGVFVSTSKVHYVADILHEYSLDINLIGYDLIDENVEHLLDGNINFLLYQNPGFQAKLGITLLVDHLVFRREIPKQRLMPIEIIIKENFKNYLELPD